MKRFLNILALVSFEHPNDTVIDKAIWLAKANNARLTLLDAETEEAGALSRLFGSAQGGEAVELEGLQSELQEARKSTVAELVARCESAGVETASVMRDGPIFISAIRQVLEGGHDLVMKAASPQGDLFFLSDDLHLMRKCPCPVWILDAEDQGAASDAKHIVLAAVDPAPADEARDTLAHTVLTLASSLAERTDADLHVVNAWYVSLEPAMRSSRVKMRVSDIDAIIDRERRLSEERLNALLDDIPDPTGRRVVAHRKGAAGDIVPAYAAEIGADTLVMGTVGRTGLSGFFIGNSAEMILNRIRCAALTTKPQGFVSPVG